MCIRDRCTPYPSDPTFLKRVEAEAVYNIRRLRNHASLAMWCGNNEILEALKYWGLDVYKRQDHLRLLPQPQQCVLAKGYFIVGKMQLSTPVLSQEWKQFVTEMGGCLLYTSRCV